VSRKLVMRPVVSSMGPEYVAELEALVATGAEQVARQEEISGLTGEDAAVADLVGDEDSETAAALSASIAATAVVWVNVLNYGNATHAGSALQAAMNAADTTKRVVFYLPAGAAYTWDAIPKIPTNIAGHWTFRFHGNAITLTSGGASLLEFAKTADYDVAQNVTVEGVGCRIDAGNIAGFGHTIIGLCTYSAISLATLSRVGVKNITVSDIQVVNVAAASGGTDLRAGVYLMASLTGAAGETAVSVTGVRVRRVSSVGGRFGVAVGARMTTSGRVFVDDVLLDDCYHDTGATPTAYRADTNFFVGGRGYGGRATIRDCWGRNSGDDGVEVNGLEQVLVDNCLIEEAASAAYYHVNYATPQQRSGQRITFRNCRYRVVALATSSTMPGKGFAAVTKAVATTTTSSVSSGASTIPLTAVSNIGSDADAFFPSTGVVTDGTQLISYTGVSGASLTGCTGIGTGISNGATITLVNDAQKVTLDGCSGYKVGQTYWETGGDGIRVTGPIRQLTVRDFDYTALSWAATIGSTAVPSAIYINAVPTEVGTSTKIRLDSLRFKLTGARSSGSTADWIAVDVNGYAPHVTWTDIEVDNAMTGMSAVNNIEALRFGRATNAAAGMSYTSVGSGLTIKSLGDVGSKQKAIHTGTQTAMGNACLFDHRGLDLVGLLTGSVTHYSDSGSFVQTRTFTEAVAEKAAVRRSKTDIAPGASPYQWQNTMQSRGVVVVSGGTVSQIQLGASSAALVTTGQTAGTFFVNPGDVVQVTYSVVPTVMTFIPVQ